MCRPDAVRWDGTVTATTTAPAGPTSLSGRALGPDLARGVMLLFIALANSHFFLRGDRYLAGFPLDGSAADSATAWTITTFVDGRAFPMFGLLFGYGVARIVARNEAAGRPGVRRLLRRRALVLVTVGVLHGLLLFAGDILAMYGVLLLVGTLAVFWRDGWVLAVAGLFFVLTALPMPGAGAEALAGPGADMLPPDLVGMVGDRAGTVAVVALLGPIGFACPFLLGLWAGRRRVLEQPDRYRAPLVVTAVVGIGAAALGAQPLALPVAGAVPLPDAVALDGALALHTATGTLGGFGYAALVVLLAARLERRRDGRRGPVVEALAALGQRSMTCYLAQSVVWAVVFTPFLLDLSSTLSVTATAALAVVTWLTTVLLADRMRRAGRRGPFETMVRRATYRTRSRP